MGETNNARHPNQFHPAYCSAMEIDFRDDRENISYDREHLLNMMPNRIDLLLIKKESDVKLKNEIGTIFQKYNIFEFKSPKDALDEKAYYMTTAYANLLIGYEHGPKCIAEITISFIRNKKPRKLISFLVQNGFIINKYADGIYHVLKPGEIIRQIIVTRELRDEHRWLKAITYGLSARTAGELMQETEGMCTKDRINAISVLTLVSSINKEFWKGDDDMGPFTQAYNEALAKINELNDQLKEKEEQLQNKDEQLQSKDEQLQGKDEQLQSSEVEISRLRLEIQKLQQKLNKIAVL